MTEAMYLLFPLTPGFSPVLANGENKNRLDGFSARPKPLERHSRQATFTARLKPGVNATKDYET